jgi:hypothetical protein
VIKGQGTDIKTVQTTDLIVGSIAGQAASHGVDMTGDLKTGDLLAQCPRRNSKRRCSAHSSASGSPSSSSTRSCPGATMSGCPTGTPSASASSSHYPFAMIIGAHVAYS